VFGQTRYCSLRSSICTRSQAFPDLKTRECVCPLDQEETEGLLWLDDKSCMTRTDIGDLQIWQETETGNGNWDSSELVIVGDTDNVITGSVNHENKIIIFLS